MSGLVRDMVLTRDGGSCVCCGDLLPAVWHAHHRLLRSRGGDDTTSNLCSLCSGCHSRVHSNPTWATRLGFMVPSGQDPALWPVKLHLSRWSLPHGGAWVPASPAQGQEAA
jgi:hypothetical protein